MRISESLNIALAIIGLIMAIKPILLANETFVNLIVGILVFVLIYSLFMVFAENFLKFYRFRKFVVIAQKFAFKHGNRREEFLIKNTFPNVGFWYWQKAITMYNPEPPMQVQDFYHFVNTLQSALILSKAFNENTASKVRSEFDELYKSASGIGTTKTKNAFKKTAIYLKKDVFKILNKTMFQEDDFKPWKLNVFEDFSRPK
jgi:hypothetical protein